MTWFLIQLITRSSIIKAQCSEKERHIITFCSLYAFLQVKKTITILNMHIMEFTMNQKYTMSSFHENHMVS